MEWQDRRFRILGPAGRGAMARVWRAWDARDGRTVALKVDAEAPAAGGRSRLEREFRIQGALRHPNVVRVRAVRTARRGPLDRGKRYLVLDWAGTPCAGGRWPAETWLAAATQLLAALIHVHAAGWVHRDVKPSNVLRAPGARLRVRLADFGLAARAGRRESAGRIGGSPAYLAPEIPAGRPVDGRADLYGLGILLHRLATGRLPQPDLRLVPVLRWHREGPPADPRPARPDFPPAWGALVAALTERRPDARPASAADALASLVRAPGARATRPPATARGSAAPG